MSQGRIEQVGTPEDIYDRPATPFVYEFLGQVNRLPCTVARGRARLWNQEFAVAGSRVERLERGHAYVRPEDLELLPDPAPDTVRARITQIAARGPIVRLELALDGLDVPLEAEISRARHRELALGPGDFLFVRARDARIFVIEEKAA